MINRLASSSYVLLAYLKTIRNPAPNTRNTLGVEATFVSDVTNSTTVEGQNQQPTGF
jgi:hypothetical protein